MMTLVGPFEAIKFRGVVSCLTREDLARVVIYPETEVISIGNTYRVTLFLSPLQY